MTPEERHQRARIIVFVLILAFSGILARLAQLQLVRGEEYAVYAQQQRIRIVEEVPRRGDILDRNGVALAASRPAYTASLVYTGEPMTEQVRMQLKWILGISDEEIDDALAQLRSHPFRPVPLLVDLSQAQVTLLEEMRHKLPGVIVEAIPVRVYPGGTLAAHVLGYLRQDVEWTLKGVDGLEGSYERPDPELFGGQDIGGLAGTPGKRLVEVDAGFQPVRLLEKIEPVPGNTIQLTLDAGLQAVVEQALDEQMEALRADRGSPCPCPAPFSAAVVMDTRTGGILALASRPAFDPNVFALQPFLRKGSARRAQIDAVISEYYQAGNSELFNRAIQGRYPPGSVFKLITALSGLEHGFGHHTVTCTGSLAHGGRVFRDWRAHGHVDLVEAIGESCNVYFWTLGLRLGMERMASTAVKLGLNGTSGLRDLPNENSGQFPFDGDPLNTAIGQGKHLYTPLQIAAVVSTIANGGTRYRPYLVDKIISPGGEVVFQAEPEVLGVVDLPEAAFADLREGMVATTSCIRGSCGTAYGSFMTAPYVVAGKTGTVERSGLSSAWNYAWFAAFAPAGSGQEPEIAVAVLIEGGGGGSRAAAPVARKIFDAYFGVTDTSTP